MKSEVKNASIDDETNDTQDHYIAYLVFDISTKNILPHPHSMCGCCDGRHRCSHVGGLILLIRCAQRCDSNQEHFENKFPENPIKLQDSITLIENIGVSQECKKCRKRKVNENQIESSRNNL